MCATCPFRPGSEHANLRPYLAAKSLSESRICHSTGTSAIAGRTGTPERTCRGSRDLQLEIMHRLGVIDAPTDQAWAETAEGIERNDLPG